MITSYFARADGDWFQPTEYARGPWDEASCHAGPVTALLVRAAEQLVEDKQLVRMTVELLRPVPMSGFSVHASVVQSGRSVARTSAEIYDGHRVYATMRAVHIRRGHTPDAPTQRTNTPAMAHMVDGPFAVGNPLHDSVWFASSVDCKYPMDHDVDGGGPTTMWMRSRVPILEDEVPSAFQKLSPLADCANGVTRNGPFDRFSFVNVDLSLSLIREPVGDWFASRAISHWQPNGIGQTDADLFDQEGLVGHATQSVILGQQK